MEERRRSNRRKLSSRLVVNRLGGVEVNETIEIDIVDVSKTGIGFTCDKALEIGAVYEGYLRIWTQEVLHAFLEIVRIEKRENDYGYGGIFIGMPEIDAARIEVYDTVESCLNSERKQ
ncbi:MAG: PilZ domain-containing protein [Lachnospiraceae bacterium]|nr:PilZ domain-containing protein [Lachnospiraceae bacterium]